LLLLERRVEIMKRKTWDRKGGEKLLSLWWFFILGVIGGFIVLGVVIYYSAETNVNSIEASILVDKLIGCLIQQGNLNSNVFNSDFDLFNECSLDKKMFGMGSFLYFNISIYDSENKLVRELVNGSGIFESDCKVGRRVSGKYFPSCISENHLVNLGNKGYKLNILGGVNQLGRKISVN